MFGRPSSWTGGLAALAGVLSIAPPALAGGGGRERVPRPRVVLVRITLKDQPTPKRAGPPKKKTTERAESARASLGRRTAEAQHGARKRPPEAPKKTPPEAQAHKRERVPPTLAEKANQVVSLRARAAEVGEALVEAQKALDGARSEETRAETHHAQRQEALNKAIEALMKADVAVTDGERARAEARSRREAAEKRGGQSEAAEDAVLGEAEAVRSLRELRAAWDRAKAAADDAAEEGLAADASLRAAIRTTRAHTGRVHTLEAEHRELLERADALEQRVARAEESLRRASRTDQSPTAGTKAHERAAAKVGLRAAVVSKGEDAPEDAFATDPVRGRVAISDGVSNSDYSGEFARALVRRWVEGPPKTEAGFEAWLRPVQAEWREQVRDAIEANKDAWYNRNREWNAAATFVGARFVKQGKQRTMHVTALGDSVLFVLRNGKRLRAFPVDKSEDFRGTVHALRSSGALPADARWRPKTAAIKVRQGDEVLMMTDALGKWTTKELEAGRDPFETLRKVRSEKDLEKFVDTHRKARANDNALEVDDVTLVRFEVP